MNALIIGTSEIRQNDGLYSLNDLHQASGGEARHRPNYFLGNDQTKALIEEISIAGIPAVYAKQKIGTYACKELVIAYAAWISPEFHLKVIRVFLGVQGTAPSLRNRRWIVYFDHNGKECVMEEPPRPSPEKQIEAWFEPNGYPFDTEFLYRLTIGCVNRLWQTIRIARLEKKTGKTVLTFGTPLPPRAGS
jgi:hypothetical protein